MSLEVSEEKFVHEVEKDTSRDLADKDIKESPNVLGFGVFYGDGSSFFGQTLEDWQNAPKESVQLILLYYDEDDGLGNHTRCSISGWDYYAFDGEMFTASNDTRNLCSDYILYGRWMDTDKWKQVVQSALRYQYSFW